jgi:hypothetical protein
VTLQATFGSPVDFTYQLPFAFPGRIEKVTIELKLPQKEAARMTAGA